jgi:hypothetical protein
MWRRVDGGVCGSASAVQTDIDDQKIIEARSAMLENEMSVKMAPLQTSV